MSETATERTERRRRKRNKLIKRGLLYMVLTVVGFTMVLPFLWMLSTSLKTRRGALEIPPNWVPREKATFANIDLSAQDELRKVLEGGDLYDEPVRVRILSKTARVRRLDSRQDVNVYDEALHLDRPWYNPWAAGEMTARFREPRDPWRPSKPDEAATKTTGVLRAVKDDDGNVTGFALTARDGIVHHLVLDDRGRALVDSMLDREVQVAGTMAQKDGARALEFAALRRVRSFSIPVEVLSTRARVRVLEEGKDLNKVVDIPGDAAYTKSWVSLKWDNYPTTWNKLPFGRAYINTIIMAVSITFGQVLTSALAAFAFARLRFPGRDKLFLGYLATMMIPGAVTLIPVYILFVKMPDLLNYIFMTDWFSKDLYFLGKYYVGRLVGGNSYFALIAPGLFSAYGTFMLRQFFMGLPRELEDAARIDGCGNLRIWWHVTLPLSRVALATLATFTFMGSWKAFMWPLIINNSEKLVPLQVLLQRFRGQYGAEYTLLMAGSIIVLFPLLLVFLLGQRYFIKGIQLGGVKG